MAVTMPKVAIVATMDAAGVKAGSEVARDAIAGLGTQAKTTAASLNLQTAAEAEATTAARAATAAIAGQTAAQAQLRSNVLAFTGASATAAKGTAFAAHEVTNLTRQFSDLGVMLGSGQSPLMAMITQGPQIADIMGQRGIRGALGGVAAGLASMASPTMLALAAITALGYGASYIFDAMQGDVDDVNLKIEDHLDLIDQVAKRWGSALPGLKAYNDELQKTKDIEDALKALRVASQEQYKEVRTALPDLSIDSAEIVSLLTLAGADTSAIGAFQREYAELKARIADTTATAQDAIDVQKALSTEVLGPAGQSVADYAQQFADFAIEVEKANKETIEYRTLQDGLTIRGRDNRPSVLTPLNPLDGFNRSPFQNEEEISAERQRRAAEAEENRRLGALVPTPTKRPNLEDSLPSAYEFIRTQDETIDRIKLEMALIGASEGLRARLIAQLDAEQEIRRRGIDAQGEEAQQLRDNASAIADATTELERHRDAWDQVQSAGENAIDGLVSKLAKGDIKGALAGLGEDFTKLMLDLAVANPLKNAAFGTNYGTLGDAGGFGGIAKRLFGGADAGAEGAAASILGKTVGSMTVNAGSVIITGAIGLAAGGTGGAAQNVTRLLTGANDNAAGATGDIAGYIRQAALARGIDPDIALSVARSEGGLKDPFRQGESLINYGTKANPLMLREESYGPFQLHMRNGGVGARALKAGIDPRTNWQGGVDFGLDEAANKGWGQWFGAAKAGIGNREGLEGARALGQFTQATKAATEATHGFDTGITGAVKAITGNGGFDWSSLFSPGFHESGGGFASLIGYGGAGAQPAAGGGGGLLQLLLGFLPSLFGFAEGTRSAPAGLAWVGERGRELINFDGGEQVIPNHQLGNLAGGGSAPTIVFQNNGTPQRLVEQRDEPDGQGGRQTVLVLEDQLTAAMSRQGSSANKHLESRGARMLGPRR